MSPDSPPESERSASTAGLLRAIAMYVEARGRLFHIEGREAGGRLTSLSGMFMMASAAFLTGWLLAVPAMVWIIAESNGWPWTRVALVAAGIHLFFGLLFLAGLKSRLRDLRLFEETFNQLRRDREWLANNKIN